MVSFAVRLLLRTINVLALIVAVCAPRAGTPQSASGADAEDALTRIADRILEAQAEGGPYAQELIEPLTHLSLLYQESGDYALEAATLQQALQVVRANYGLRSLEQAPLIRQRIRGEESIGNFAAAWDLEQALLSLARRHPDDLRTVPILHEIGDKRMELLKAHLAGKRPPQVLLGCFYEPAQRFPDSSRNCHSGQRSVAARQILSDAQRNYANAIRVLLGQEAYASDELHELENKLLRNSYLFRDYRGGRQSLVRLISYDTANAEPLTSRIERLVQLADWDFIYGQRTLAFDLYAETYGFLEAQGIAQARIEEIFSPEVPVVLPTFVPSLFAPERAEGATGYVDVAFDLTQYGSARRIRTLDTTHNASRAAQHRLSRWIVENQFRPRVINGQLAEPSRVVVRHYVHE